MRNSFLSLVVAAIFVVSFSATAKAELFTAYLSSAQEVPTNASTATGYARIFLNEATGTLNFTLVFNGLSSNQTASHIHGAGAIGVNAPVIIDFGAVGGTSGTISGSRSITPTQINMLRQGLAYVNVHTANNPGGEIRGQLAKKRPVDFDGDGRQDYSVLKFPTGPPSPITYWNMNTSTGFQTAQWGDATTDFPAPGDYDGDGKDDFVIYREGATVGNPSFFWIFRSSNNTGIASQYGQFNDVPHCRDFDGDGITDQAVVRPGATSTAQLTWWIHQSSTDTDRVISFGITGNGTTSFDAPIAGDYDGDGKFDLAVYRFGNTPINTFIILRSTDGVITYTNFGNFNTDYILPGDYDGDGKYDLAVGRTGSVATSPMVWWVINSSTGSVTARQWGISSDLPTQGDYDGDGKTDLSIYRRGATAGATSSFWTFRSFDGTAQQFVWGLQPDFPLATFDAR